MICRAGIRAAQLQSNISYKLVKYLSFDNAFKNLAGDLGATYGTITELIEKKGVMWVNSHDCVRLPKLSVRLKRV